MVRDNVMCMHATWRCCCPGMTLRESHDTAAMQRACQLTADGAYCWYKRLNWILSCMGCCSMKEMARSAGHLACCAWCCAIMQSAGYALTELSALKASTLWAETGEDIVECQNLISMCLGSIARVKGWMRAEDGDDGGVPSAATCEVAASLMPSSALLRVLMVSKLRY